MESNRLKVSIEERDLVSIFLIGEAGLFPSNVSWNDLMPVIAKCYSFQKGKWHDKSRGFATGIWLSMQEKIDIQQTWKEVIICIKYLNSQNKKP